MDDDDRPRPRGDNASRLTSESLDSYSQDELVIRIAQLTDEIERCRAHMAKAAAHRKLAESLFGAKPAEPPA